MKDFFDAVKNRRTIYALGKDRIVPAEKIRELVEFAVKNVPSPFNSQSARVVILFGDESDKFWALTKDVLRNIVPEAAFAQTAQKIDGFSAGYGTVLFFEDQTVVNQLMANFPLYKDNFPIWSLQSNGMLEFAVWTSLEAEGLGASLQHYNPLVDDGVKKAWGLPESWKLLAEMPFGAVKAPAGEKEFQPVETRLKVFGK
jgi:predicted oxidoreductase (fatty acid repression mutant protein)